MYQRASRNAGATQARMPDSASTSSQASNGAEKSTTVVTPLFSSSAIATRTLAASPSGSFSKMVRNSYSDEW